MKVEEVLFKLNEICKKVGRTKVFSEMGYETVSVYWIWKRKNEIPRKGMLAIERIFKKYDK